MVDALVIHNDMLASANLSHEFRPVATERQLARLVQHTGVDQCRGHQSESNQR